MSKPLIDFVKVGKNGEITLPRKVRGKLELQEGDELMLTLDEKRITLERRTRGVRAYLEVMTPSEEPPPQPEAPAPRRGLGRYLTGR